MKVAFVFPHLSYGSAGSFQRTYLMCKALKGHGIDIVICTPFEEDKKIISDIELELIPSLFSQLQLSSLVYKATRKLSSSSLTSWILLSERNLNQVARSTFRGLERILERRRFDIIHAVQQHTALGCIPLARKHNIPLITDVHNIWVEEAISGQHGHIRMENKVYVGLKKIESEILLKSDALTVPTDYMKSYITSNFQIDDKRITVVPQGGYTVDESSLALNREENVVYSGMVNRREHVDLYAQSIQYIKSPALFFISNYGDMLSYVKKITSRANDPRVNYVWFKHRREVLDLLKKSKVGILTSVNDTARQLGPAAKLYEYLSCGMPVVANNIGGWTELIDKYGVGITTKDDPRAFAESIDKLLNDHTLWNKMHKNCLEIVRARFNWNKIVKETLIPLYSEILR